MRDNEIQMSPTLYHQAEAILGILARYEWWKYSIIVTGFSGSEEFLKAAENLTDNIKRNSANTKPYLIICLFKTRFYLIILRFEILTTLKVKPKKGNRDELRRKFKSISLETRVIVLHCD